MSGFKCGNLDSGLAEDAPSAYTAAVLQPRNCMFELFFAHLGIGLLACLLFVPLRRLGPQFFASNTGIALAFLVLAAATRASRDHPTNLALWICIGFAAAHVASLRFRARALSMVLLASAVAAGAVALWRDAITLAAHPAAHASASLLAAHFATSALVTGAVTLDMILGHFYLMIPNLSFGPLRRSTLVFAVALALRIAVIAWTLVGSWDVWAAAWHTDATRFLLEYGFFLTLRVMFGILGPAVLAYLVWECVRIRSNQSATGILYVATAIVLIGEIAAKYFLTTEALLL